MRQWVASGGAAAACDDGSTCTVGDVCSGTNCIGQPAVDAGAFRYFNGDRATYNWTASASSFPDSGTWAPDSNGPVFRAVPPGTPDTVLLGQWFNDTEVNRYLDDQEPPGTPRADGGSRFSGPSPIVNVATSSFPGGVPLYVHAYRCITQGTVGTNPACPGNLRNWYGLDGSQPAPHASGDAGLPMPTGYFVCPP